MNMWSLRGGTHTCTHVTQRSHGSAGRTGIGGLVAEPGNVVQQLDTCRGSQESHAVHQLSKYDLYIGLK